MSVDAQHGYLKLVAENINTQFKTICSGAAYGDNDYKNIFPESNIIFVDMVSENGIDFVWNLEQQPRKSLKIRVTCLYQPPS